MKTGFKRLVSVFLTVAMICSLAVLPAQAAGEQITVRASNATWNGKTCTVQVISESSANYDLVGGQIPLKFDNTLLTFQSATAGTLPGGLGVMLPSNATAINTANTNGEVPIGFANMAMTNASIPNGQVFATFTFVVKDGVETTDTEFTIAESFKLEYQDLGGNTLQHTSVRTPPLPTTVQGDLPSFTQKTVTLSPDTLTVNGTDEATATISVVSSKGTPITSSVAYTVTFGANHEPTTDVSVASNGTVTAKPKAKAGTYTIAIAGVAGKSSGSASVTLTVGRNPSVASALEIKRGSTEVGNTDTLVIPTTGSQNYAYTATVLDQYGGTMTGQTASFVSTGPVPSGVTVTNNTVTVTSDAEPGSLTLEVTCGSVRETITVTITDLIITWPTAEQLFKAGTHYYGDANKDLVQAAYANGTATGTATGESVIRGTFSLADPDAILPATGATAVTAIVLKFTGEDGTTVTKSYPVTIVPQPLNITDGSFQVSKEFDNTEAAGEISGELDLSGKIVPADKDKVYVKRTVVGSENVSDVTVSAYPGKNIGIYTVTVSGISLDGAAKNNYSVPATYSFTKAEITKVKPTLADLTVTVPAASPYDGNAREARIESTKDGMGEITVKYAKKAEDGTFSKSDATEAKPVNAGQYQVIASIDEGTNFARWDLDTTQVLVINKAERNLAFKDGSALTLHPKALTGALEFTCNDADQSAKAAATYTLTGDVTAVSRKDNSFTAVGNGTVTVEIAIPATENYNASSSITGTVKAIKEPITAVSVGSGLAAVINGKTIVVSGVAADDSVPTVTATTASGVTAAQDGKTLNITLDGSMEVIDTYTIDTSNVIVKPAGVEIDAAAAGNVTSSVSGAVESVAKTLLPEADTLKTQKDTEIKAALGDVPYIVRVKVSVEVNAENPYAPAPGTLTITPTYTIVAEADGNPSNNHTVQSAKDVPAGAFKTPVTVGFQTGTTYTYALHNGQYLPVTMDGGYATWQMNSPSGEVTLVKSDPTVTIVYTMTNGTTQTVVHKLSDLAMPADIGGGSGTFSGWNLFDGETAVTDGQNLKALTFDLLTTLNGKTLTAKAGVTTPPRRPGGGSGGSYTPNVTGAHSVTIKRPSNGSLSTSPSSAKQGDTVTLTVKPNSGYELDRLTVTDKDGNTIRVREQNETTFTFTMPDSTVTVEATFKAVENTAKNPFNDVSSRSYYYDAVLWAVENGVTGGTTATTFSPNAACTRAQTVTFLWRAAGSPAPSSRNNPFTDVAPGSYYYDAVLWAVENGITTGLTSTTFGPNATVNRGQVVTFLYRSARASATNAANPFTDVPANAYYTNAVLWAVENGITNGTTATRFSPAERCTRAQIVTFLYRHFV